MSARHPATTSVPTAPLHPVTLTGERVRLEPLGHEHAPGLREAVADGDIHRLPFAPHVPAPEGVEVEIERMLEAAAAGTVVPWAVLDAADGTVLGQTTFLNLALADRGLEIGSTYLRGSVHRTGVNTEMKLLLLRHAFEDLQCLRVEFRVHHLNIASRRAVEALGAQLDGILRAHRILPDGTVRHTCVYSILATEWPGVRVMLEERLAARYGA